MAIPQNRYVAIMSGVSGTSEVTRRELIARIVTTNPLAPAGKTLEFANISEVGKYFGASSAEYAWASRYFGYISKSFRSPDKISFARYADENIPASVICTKSPASVEDIVDDGDFTLYVSVNGASAVEVSGDYGEEPPTDYAGIVNKVTSEMDGAGFNVTMSYDNSVFSFTGGSGVDSLEISGDAETMALLGLSDPIVNTKVDAETPVEAIARVAEISDNFASFAFIDTLTAAQMTQIAAWVTAQNFKYLFCLPCTETTYNDVATAVNGCSGVWVQVVSASGNDEFMPAAIAAATNYEGNDATQNYMFQQFGGAVPVVTTTEKADLYDGKRINYYGQTQRAGRQLSFLQRGVLMDGMDAGVYVHEIWLKDALQTDLLNLLIGQPKIPASVKGESMAAAAMQGTINQALANGTIMPGKELTDAQKVSVDNITGVAGSWFDVQTSGYKLKVQIIRDTNAPGEYKLNYLLVYSKGDSIRKIEGTDVLI